MLNVELIPILNDNYTYLLQDTESHAVGIVDPGAADPVLEMLEQRGLALTHILITHHHGDHIDGMKTLRKKYGAHVCGPRGEVDKIGNLDTVLGEGDTFQFGAETAGIIETPGHTLGHIAYWFEKSGKLFCGDTLFAMGCGRVFEGSLEQMYESLRKLGELPSDTQIYCGHEYTVANGEFAMNIEPDNGTLRQRLNTVKAARARGEPTLPSTIREELQTNVFLRARDAAHFAEIRRAKDAA